MIDYFKCQTATLLGWAGCHVVTKPLSVRGGGLSTRVKTAWIMRIHCDKRYCNYLHTSPTHNNPPKYNSTLTLSSPPHSPPLLTTSRRGTLSRPGKLSTASHPNAGTRALTTASVPLSAPPRSLCRLLRSQRWRKLAAPSAKRGGHEEQKITSLHVDHSVYLTCFSAYDSKMEFSIPVTNRSSRTTPLNQSMYKAIEPKNFFCHPSLIL